MEVMASNLCKSLFVNSDVEAVMYAKREDIINETNRINRVITTSVASNPYIHSITVYNNYLHRFYNGGNSLFFDDKELIEMIDNKKMLPKLKAVSRNIERVVSDKRVDENVFSYFMYTISEETGELDGAIAININTKWFLENVRQINMIEKNQGESVFVLDGNTNFIDVGQENSRMKEWLKEEYIKHLSKVPLNANVDFFKSKYDGVNYLVTYSYINSMNISIIKVQELSEVYRSINNLRMSIIIITLVFLVAALLISTGISKKIYKPVGKLVQQVSTSKNQNMESNRWVDEITYLSNIYKTTMEKLDVYSKERYKNRDIMKQYWLKRLLEKSHTIDAQRVKSIFEEEKISLLGEDRFLVCVLKLDNFKFFQTEYNSKKDRELIRFASINISSEVVGRKYSNEDIDMKEDYIVLIIGIPNHESDFMTEVAGLIKESQEYLKKYFKISLSASLSDCTNDICRITLLYNQALDNLAYKLKLGHSSIITPEHAVHERNNLISFDFKPFETLLMEKIKSHNFYETEAVLKEIFDGISKLEYDRILISLINTASVINNSVDNLKIAGSKYLHFDFNAVCKDIMEKETLADIYDAMVERLRNILEQQVDHFEKSKDNFIVEAVKDFIKNNYQDSSLSLTKISDAMNTSARRLSKVFKDEMDVFIPDYINEVRLNKAAEMLEQTSLNIDEILIRVGIDNKSYFYRIFKKKFGLTPKEYSFKRIINMTE